MYNIKRALASTIAIVLAVTSLVGCGMNKDEVLVNINKGSDEISLGFYNFAAKYQQSVLDVNYGSMMGDNPWTRDLGGSMGTMEDSVKEQTLESIEEAYLCEAHREDYDVSISDEEKKSIEEAAGAFIEGNSKKALKAMGATREYVERYLTLNYFREKVSAKVKEEIEVNIPESESVQSTISYVLFSTEPVKPESETEEGEPVPLSQEEIAGKEVLANEFLAHGDFDTAIGKSGLEALKYTYTAAMDPNEDTNLGAEVIKAAQALKDGEMSSAIYVENKGYYIVKMEAENDSEATKEKSKELETSERDGHYKEVLENWKSEITWKVDKKVLSKVKFDSIFEMSGEMEKELQAGE